MDFWETERFSSFYHCGQAGVCLPRMTYLEQNRKEKTPKQFTSFCKDVRWLLTPNKTDTKSNNGTKLKVIANVLDVYCAVQMIGRLRNKFRVS